MTDPIERLRRDLDRLADQAPLVHADQPAAPPTRRSPERGIGRFIPVAAVAIIVALVIAGVVAHDRTRRAHVATTTPTTTVTHYRPSTEIVVLDRGRLKIINAGTGKGLHSVKVHGPSAPTDYYDSPLTVSLNGRTVYEELRPKLCRNASVVSISTISGRETTVVRHAVNPALSPNGQFLAYTAAVPYPKRFGDPQGCATGRTYVRDLETGQVHTWNITTHVTGDQAPQLITGLAWAADNRHLILTSTGAHLPDSLTQILDTAAPQSTTNPLNVGGDTAYASPILLPNGNLMGVVETCANDASCPPMSLPTGSTINTVTPATGHILSTFHTRQPVETLLLDPSGQHLEAITGHRNSLTFQHLKDRHFTPTFTTTDFATYGWIPRLK
jgi:hypothetical protein